MASRHRSTRGAGSAGLGRMTRLGLRTGWLGLLAVAVVAAGLVAGIAASIEALYPTLADRQQYAATVGSSPATQAFNGRGYGLSTIGGVTAYEVGFLGQLLFPFLGLHVALRHTRREEEAGRTEVVTAGRVGRLAPLAAGALLVTLTCLVTTGLVLLGQVAAGLPAGGSLRYAGGLGLLMLFFGAVGLLLGQLAESTRTAYLVGLVVLTAAFLVRALVDGLGWEAVWASPLGWAAEVRPFEEPRAWPLLAYAAGSLLLIALAVLVARTRDLGAGMLAPRPGPARARPALGTVAGLAWRLNRGVVVSWGVLAVVWAGVFGMLTQEMTSLVEANPSMLEAMGLERGSDLVTSLAVVVVSLAATAVAVQGLGRLGAEESADRLGALLATRVSRARLWLLWWAVVAAAALGVLALGCLALGLATWASTGDPDTVAAALEVGLGYAVPVVFVAALAAALRALVPAWSALAWAMVAWIALVGFLAETLRLPGWARDLSPLHLVGSLPREDLDVAATTGLALGVLVLLLVSLQAFRRRDLRVG